MTSPWHFALLALAIALLVWFLWVSWEQKKNWECTYALNPTAEDRRLCAPAPYPSVCFELLGYQSHCGRKEN